MNNFTSLRINFQQRPCEALYIQVSGVLHLRIPFLSQRVLLLGEAVREGSLVLCRSSAMPELQENIEPICCRLSFEPATVASISATSDADGCLTCSCYSNPGDGLPPEQIMLSIIRVFPMHELTCWSRVILQPIGDVPGTGVRAAHPKVLLFIYFDTIDVFCCKGRFGATFEAQDIKEPHTGR